MDDLNKAGGLEQVRVEIARLLDGAARVSGPLSAQQTLPPQLGDRVTRSTGSEAVASVPPAASVAGAGRGTKGVTNAASLVASIVSPAVPLLNTGNTASGWLRWLNPIASLITLLAGGRDQEQDAPAGLQASGPTPATLRRGIEARNGWRIQDADATSDGKARAMEPVNQPTTVVVQVQAIDSRSFLDHSDAIADAVKKSLMESHGLTDALREL